MGKGNTQGRLQGEVAASKTSASKSNPPIKPETKDEGWWAATSPWVHGGLSLLGVIPVVGAIFDGADAIVYAAEGDTVNAAISGGAAVLDLIPAVGTAGKAAEFGVKAGIKGGELIAEQATKQTAKEVAKQVEKKTAADAAKAGEKQAAGKTGLAESRGLRDTGKSADSGGGKINGTKRPSWRESEKDVGNKLDGHREQVSFKDGEEVKYGTKGSTRPDWYKDGSSVEVKNYNVETRAGQERLIDNVSSQAKSRAKDLPKGTVQSIYIDVRGQKISMDRLEEVIQTISEKSNGTIKYESIQILR
ncbi:hypothetical protein NK8_41750 [Caballeronia sp. NK8]|uniref:hypothetical protein n=1 Tax=Caballeronia sp. NK8 TaxID=140098 RepID=UPI001BB6E6AA|nr:hypothetical protein [Caballeronia sp. NK8]BCQ25991.1 hypothetical protein NK8_41750 [Caballeronia sp. NK8]